MSGSCEGLGVVKIQLCVEADCAMRMLSVIQYWMEFMKTGVSIITANNLRRG